MVQLSHPYMTTGKIIALTMGTFIGKVISLLFNKPSRFVIAFLPRSKCLLTSNCQHSFDQRQKARESQKNIFFCFIKYTKAFDCVGQKQLWKILREMGVPDHLTCVVRYLYVGQEATVRLGTTDLFKIGKGVCQGCILSPCLSNF